ncbi:GlsB/YeaQ/YmgE family stress response membrane protein [Rhodocista pekingensis]|uniref:GlsB/YeaQ/YmgE family stress response membrane protein n=1 Tax=Rhodocista pekingensis TaxID=201185 RepID=A0ABW2KZ64_9PROT
MEILWTLIIGLLAGIVAKFLMPGRDPGGFIITTLLGIAGAFAATYLGQAIGWYRAGEGAGFIGAVVGAIILLAVYRMVAGRRSTTV